MLVLATSFHSVPDHEAMFIHEYLKALQSPERAAFDFHRNNFAIPI
jgi:hypothetical protein